MIHHHRIVRTEMLPPRLNRFGRPVAVASDTYSNGLRLTYELERGGPPILVHVEEPPPRPLPCLKGWKLNLPEGESHGV
jgi:hypothetical protein